MATNLCTTSLGGVIVMSAPDMKLIGPRTIILSYRNFYLITLRDLVTLTFDLDLGVMSRGGIWVVNACANFEMYTTYRSRVIRITIFH